MRTRSSDCDGKLCRAGFYCDDDECLPCPTVFTSPTNTASSSFSDGITDCAWSILDGNTSMLPYNAYITQTQPSSWEGDDWISLVAKESNSLDRGGMFHYSTNFTLNYNDYDCLKLSLKYVVDNSMYLISLNGKEVYNCTKGCGGYKSYTYIDVGGVDTLAKHNQMIFKIKNSYASPSGLLVKFLGISGCNCPAGSYQIAGGPCLDCPVGTYSTGSAGACTPCPAGSFQPYLESTSCFRCGSGFTSAIGSTTCEPCPLTTDKPLSTATVFGMTDCFWSLVKVPVDQGPINPLPYNAFVPLTERYAGGWAQKNWIAPSYNQSNGVGMEAPGHYIYSHRFNMTEEVTDYQCYSLPFTFSADDYVLSIALNGVNATVGQPNTYNEVTNGTILFGFQRNNIIEVTVNNNGFSAGSDPNPTGLAMTFHALQGCTCPPGQFNLAGEPCQPCENGLTSSGKSSTCFPISPSSSSSQGMMQGIVIGVVLGVFFLVVSIGFYWRNVHLKRKEEDGILKLRDWIKNDGGGEVQVIEKSALQLENLYDMNHATTEGKTRGSNPSYRFDEEVVAATLSSSSK